MKLLLFIIPVFYIISFFIANFINTPPKLSGNPISSDSSSSSVKNAFDNDLLTYFKSEKPSNGWIGVQLDGQYKISKIGLAFPKDSKKEDYLLGIIEGSNDPTFFDADPLYMITEEINISKINYFKIKATKKYEYIRYIGPNNRYCILSDLEIFGDGKIDTNLNSKKVSDEDQNYYYQATNLPLVVIHTKDSEEPYDKEHYIECSITIINNKSKRY